MKRRRMKMRRRRMRAPPGVQLFPEVLSKSGLNEARLRDIQRVPAALLGIVSSSSSSTTSSAPFGVAVIKAHQGYLHPTAIRLTGEPPVRRVEHLPVAQEVEADEIRRAECAWLLCACTLLVLPPPSSGL